jgi:hypothetical protein
MKYLKPTKGKIKLYFLILIFVILLWSPWMGEDGGENVVRKLQSFDTYKRAVELMKEDGFCDGVHTVWAPFGRKVKYCDRAEWYVTFWGQIFSGHIARNVSDLKLETLLKRFDIYKNKIELPGEDNFCRTGSREIPALAAGRLVSVREPEDKEDSYAMKSLQFRGEQGEIKFYFPSDQTKITVEDVGNFYLIDMNNFCIYQSVMLDSYYPSKHLQDFVYPEKFNPKDI